MNSQINFAFLRNQSIFAGLGDKELKGIAADTRVKTINRSELIDHGTGPLSKIYFVVRGKIKITESNEFDEELVKDILTDGDFFGDLGLEGAAPKELSQALISNTIVCYFYISDFIRILESNPALTLKYTQRVGRKLRKLETRHADLVFRDTKSRLLRFIKNWAMTDGNKVGDKIILDNYLTHGEIAGFISTSRQNVNVLLNELRDLGHLHYNRKTIELNNTLAWHW